MGTDPWVVEGRDGHVAELELFLAEFQGVRSRRTAFRWTWTSSQARLCEKPDPPSGEARLKAYLGFAIDQMARKGITKSGRC